MKCSAVIVFVIALTPTWAILFYHCAKPSPQPEVKKYVTVMSSWLDWNATFDSSSLAHQLLHNPCLEVEYYGDKIEHSFFYSIYGTCNNEEMFRYTARIMAPYGCCRTELEYSRKPGNPCERFPLNHTLTLFWDKISMDICMDSKLTQRMNLYIAETYFDGFTVREQREWLRAPPRLFNDARVQECWCNRSGQPRQSETWQRERRCAREPREQQLTALNGFGWLAVALLMVGAIGALGAVLYWRMK